MTQRRSSRMIPALIAVSLFLVGVASATITPYRAIAAIDELGMDRSTFAMVMTAGSIIGALGSMALGAIADHLRDRRPLALACAVLGTGGYGLVWVLPGQISLIVALGALMPFATASLSQTYSYTRAWYDEHRPGDGDRAMSVLRTAFSASWVIMPPIAGWIAAQGRALDTFGVAALASLVAAMAMGALLMRADGQTTRKKPTPLAGQGAFPLFRRVGVLGALLLRTAIILHMMTLPMVITHDLGGSLDQVGINAAIAAALEVPMMLAWGFLIARLGKERILGLSGLIFAAYLFGMSQAHSVLQSYLLQVVNAVGLSALLSVMISYLQDAIRGRVGLSTALLDAVTVTATLLASALFGYWPGGAGFQPLFMAGAAISALGAVIVWASPRLARPMPDGA